MLYFFTAVIAAFFASPILAEAQLAKESARALVDQDGT
jgi:hypothetical protein